MSKGRMQTYKYVFLMALIVVFTGCFFSAKDSSYCFDRGNAKSVYSKTHREQMSSADDMEIKDIADSILRMESVSRMGRSTNRLYFNSLLAVLFKIAVISSIIIIVVIMAERRVLPALGRILRFVHDSDGKKEMWILQRGI